MKSELSQHHFDSDNDTSIAVEVQEADIYKDQQSPDSLNSKCSNVGETMFNK